MDKFPPKASAANRTLVIVQYKSGATDAWRCDSVAVDANSRYLQLLNASSYDAEGNLLRFAGVGIVLDALVLWTKDVD